MVRRGMDDKPMTPGDTGALLLCPQPVHPRRMRVDLWASARADYPSAALARRHPRIVPRFDRAKVYVATCCLIAVATTIGCGRPKGMLFEPIQPPIAWPAPPQVARVVLIGTIESSSDLKPARSGGEALRTILRGRRPPIAFVSPHGVAVHPRGILAVADAGAAAVHVLDLNERTHHRVAGWQGERFAVPIGVAWVEDRLYVTDAGRHEVVIIGPTGRFFGSFGAELLKRPVGVTWDGTHDELFVVDGQAHAILVFSREGSPIRTIGEQGAAPGRFNFPSHVAIRGDRLLVADSGNFRVQLLDRYGASLRSFGVKGNGAGDFALPKGVGFDSEGHLYVVDAQFENFQVFGDQGRLLLAVGNEGREPGEFWLPAGIAVDNQDRLWIADAGNHRVQVFQYISQEAESPLAADGFGGAPLGKRHPNQKGRETMGAPTGACQLSLDLGNAS